jgi:hypothetical protein
MAYEEWKGSLRNGIREDQAQNQRIKRMRKKNGSGTDSGV